MLPRAFCVQAYDCYGTFSNNWLIARLVMASEWTSDRVIFPATWCIKPIYHLIALLCFNFSRRTKIVRTNLSKLIVGLFLLAFTGLYVFSQPPDGFVENARCTTNTGEVCNGIPVICTEEGQACVRCDADGIMTKWCHTQNNNWCGYYNGTNGQPNYLACADRLTGTCVASGGSLLCAISNPNAGKCSLLVCMGTTTTPPEY